MSRGFFFLSLVLILSLGGLGAASFKFASAQQAPKSAAVGGPFHLTSTDGNKVADTDFMRHPFLIYFGYTHCPDICPTVLSQMSQVLNAMGEKRMKAVFVTVDPERDTPPVMKEYLSSFNPNIIGLSGTREETEAIEKVYHVYARRGPGQGTDYAIDHTAFVFLVAHQGSLVTPFDIDRAPQVVAEELSAYL
jgi:protein SCO1